MSVVKRRRGEGHFADPAFAPYEAKVTGNGRPRPKLAEAGVGAVYFVRAELNCRRLKNS
jgi:hypothetical protein